MGLLIWEKKSQTEYLKKLQNSQKFEFFPTQGTRFCIFYFLLGSIFKFPVARPYQTPKLVAPLPNLHPPSPWDLYARVTSSF